MLATRVLILLAAAAALLAGISTTRKRAGASGAAMARAYVCPMHPEVAGAAAGECPICRMTLVRRDDVGDVRRNVGAVRSRVTAREIVAPAWRDGSSAIVNALLYDDEIAMLAPRQTADFAVAETSDSQRPPAAVTSVRMTDAPPRRWDGATSVVRFEARADKVRAGRQPGHEMEIGWIQLAGPARSVVVAPRSALLASPAGPYLLIASADLRTLTPRPVHIGRTVAGAVTLVDGAREGERVVASDAFFVDAQRRLAGAGP